VTEILQMTDLFATVPGVVSTKGVAMNPPPAAILGDVSKMVRDAMLTLPEEDRVELVGIASRDEDTGKVNVNLALAAKAGQHVDIVAFMGKSWGDPVSAAVMARVHF
jgi:hypothetical protein